MKIDIGIYYGPIDLLVYLVRKKEVDIFDIPIAQIAEEYLDYVVARVLVLGSAYLCAVCLLPEILRSTFAIPFYFGGTSVLIVVSVTMDTINQVQSHLLAHQYEGLIERSKLRGKDRAKARKRKTRR